MEHTASFHAALERMGTVAKLFKEGLDEDQMLAQAKSQGLTERDANLAIQLLPKDCGCVFVNELGANTPVEYELMESGNTIAIPIASDDNFQEAFFLAYHLRHGGRNDLFKTITSKSTIINTRIEDLKDGSISFFNLVLNE